MLSNLPLALGKERYMSEEKDVARANETLKKLRVKCQKVGKASNIRNDKKYEGKK